MLTFPELLFTVTSWILLGQQLLVGGSLGGLQVLDLTPEGQRHQRILSLGKDPLVTERAPDLVTCLGAALYAMGQTSSIIHVGPEEKQVQAFSFSVSCSLGTVTSAGGADIVVEENQMSLTLDYYSLENFSTNLVCCRPLV